MNSKTNRFYNLLKSKALGLSLVLILLFLTLGSWALASPVASSPDDDFHLASIWCSGDGYPGMCESAEVPNERYLSRALVDSACYAHDPEISAGCQSKIHVLEDNTLQISTRGNFNGGYPPLYYSVMHTFATTNVELSVFVMRIVNISIFMILGALIWVFGSQQNRKMQTYPWLISSIPLGIFILASNNPSSWGFTGVGMGALSLYSLFTCSKSPLKNRIILITVYYISTCMASGARGDSALFSVITAAIITFITFTNWTQTLKNLIIIAPAVITSVLFYFSSAAATSVARVGAVSETSQVSPISVLFENLLTLPDLFIGVFGVWGLGWLDTPMPQLVWVTAAFIFVSFVAISWQKMTKKQMFAQVGLLLIIVFLPLYILQKELATVGQFLQPRYFLPLYLLLSILVFEILIKQQFRASSFFKTIVWVGLSVAQAIALYLNLDRYVHGSANSTGFNLNNSVEWWWSGLQFGPMQLFVIGALSFCFLSFLLIRPLNDEPTELQIKL